MNYENGKDQVHKYSQSEFCMTFRSADYEYDYDYGNETLGDDDQLVEKDDDQLLDDEKALALLHPHLYVCENFDER